MGVVKSATPRSPSGERGRRSTRATIDLSRRKDVGRQVGKRIGSSNQPKNGVDTTVSSLGFPEPRLWLQTERVGSDSATRFLQL